MDRGTQIVVLLGPPGSGKGTQANRLAEKTGLKHISTGEILRREADSGSEIGKQVRHLLSTGLLVGDDLMNETVKRRLSCEDCMRGSILDGYPRTLQQAHYLEELLTTGGISEPVAFDFVVSGEAVVERLSQRRQCPKCGKIYSAEFDVYGKDLVCNIDGTPLVRRSDDNPDAIRERLQIYQYNSRDLVAFYKARRYFAIDAMQPPDQISLELMRLMNTLTKPTSPSSAPKAIPLSKIQISTPK